MSLQLATRAYTITPSPTMAVDAMAKRMQAEGVQVVGFGAGEPDFDTPPHIKQAAVDALMGGATKYTASSGDIKAREAIAEKLLKDNKLKYDPNQITLSAGAKHACFNAIMATVNPGDEVIIMAPYWVSYPEMVKMAGGKPVIVQTEASNNYEPSRGELEKHIKPGKTKMIILNTPGNPTGAVNSQKFLINVAALASKHGCYVLSDEIYEKLLYDDAKHRSIASFSPELYQQTITVNGFSKPYAMTGWRLGYTAAGDKEVAAAIDAIQSHSTSNVTSFAQAGVGAALLGPQECVEEMRQVYDRRRHLMMEHARAIPGVTFTEPKGAFYLMLDISSTGIDSTTFAGELLKRQNVAVVPGIAFGDDRAIRLSYATSDERIRDGMVKMALFVEHHVPGIRREMGIDVAPATAPVERLVAAPAATSRLVVPLGTREGELAKRTPQK